MQSGADRAVSDAARAGPVLAVRTVTEFHQLLDEVVARPAWSICGDRHRDGTAAADVNAVVVVTTGTGGGAVGYGRGVGPE